VRRDRYSVFPWAHARAASLWDILRLVSTQS
jgi:hypothetical protein